MDMTVFEAIAARRSIRAYARRPVEPEKITRIFEAARLAPSSSNRQEWRFVVVNDRETVEAVAAAACPQPFVARAPVLIAACAQTDLHKMQCGQLSYPIDVAIALDHAQLAAAALGLGACWIGMFEEAPVKQLLGIPEEIRVVSLMTMGYPGEERPANKGRLTISSILRFNKW